MDHPTAMTAAVDAVDGHRHYRAAAHDDYTAREAALADTAQLLPPDDQVAWDPPAAPRRAREDTHTDVDTDCL